MNDTRNAVLPKGDFLDNDTLAQRFRYGLAVVLIVVAVFVLATGLTDPVFVVMALGLAAGITAFAEEIWGQPTAANVWTVLLGASALALVLAWGVVGLAPFLH